MIVWLVKRAREEHRAAVEWLNNHTDENIGFFLCEIKLFRIGSSDPAVKFEVVERPNDWTKEVKKARHRMRASSFATTTGLHSRTMPFRTHAFRTASAVASPRRSIG